MTSAGKLIRYRAARSSCSDARTELLAGKMALNNYCYMASNFLSVCTGVNGLY